MTKPIPPELAACPFCGSDPTPDFSNIEGEHAYHFHCQNKDCPAWPNVSGDTEAEAIAAWNQRTKPAVPDVREAVNRLHDNLAAAPPEADKCFVSLDDHRAILAALTQSPTCCEAERERCAKIAERMYEGHGFTLATDRARNFEHAARRIATAIRGADQ